MIPTRISHYPRRDGPLPEGARWVGRPSRWGNKDVVRRWKGLWSVSYRDMSGTWYSHACYDQRPDALALAVARFRLYAGDRLAVEPTWLDPLRDATALACACPLDQPCHVDVLLGLLRGAS